MDERSPTWPDPDQNLPALLLTSSDHLGWTSASVRTYRDDPETDVVELRPVEDPTLVLVTGGVYRIESRSDGRWRPAVFRDGSIALTPPATTNTLRWRTLSPEPMTSVHVHVAAETWRQVSATVVRTGAPLPFPNALTEHDPLVGTLLRTLHAAAVSGAPAAYADTVVHLLCSHLALRSTGGDPGTGRPTTGLSDKALGDVVAHMDRHLGQDLSLDALAAEVGLSKYHFLRQFKAATGQTPFAFLTARRMQRAAAMLAQGRHSVDGTAHACGYRSASRFSAAFRRHHGVTPARWRDAR